MEKIEIAERAGGILKALRLALNPMMDRVAVRLNAGITYEEKEQAKQWKRALELAEQEGSIFDHAATIYNER